jgi:hypothetical protein
MPCPPHPPWIYSNIWWKLNDHHVVIVHRQSCKPLCISDPSHACYMSRISHSPWIDYTSI